MQEETDFLETLRANAEALCAAKHDFLKRTGDDSPSRAYQQDATVQRYANALFQQCASMVGTQVAKMTLPHQALLDSDDLRAIGKYGPAEKDGFGGLMGAILKNTSSDEPGRILAYYKTRVRGEIRDYLKQQYGRKDSIISHIKADLNNALPLSVFPKQDEINGTYFGTSDEISFGIGDAKGLLAASQHMREPDKSLMTPILYAFVESGDASQVAAWIKERTLADPTGQLHAALVELHSEYLKLDDDQLPEQIILQKEAVAAKKAHPKACAEAVYHFAAKMGLSSADLGMLIGVSEGSVYRMRRTGSVPQALITALGLEGRVHPSRSHSAPAPQAEPAGQSAPEASMEEKTGFSDKLFQLRQETGLIDPAAFADAINQNARMDFPERGNIDSRLIMEVQTNEHHPSNGMMLAMVRALDTHRPDRPLPDEDKKALYDLHHAQTAQLPHHMQKSSEAKEKARGERRETAHGYS